MERGIILSKLSKRSLKRRRQTTYLLLLLIVLSVLISPFVWRMNRLRVAESGYDFQTVKEELQWWEEHGSLLNHLGIIRDASLRYQLNIGGDNLESELAMYQDEKHQFWLFLLNLRNGKTIEAQNVLNLLDQKPLGTLGQGLILMAKGDVEESVQLLAEVEQDWKSMSKEAQALRHLTLAQAGMIMGDRQVTQTELAAAQSLNPNNPAYVPMAFDIAIGEGQWRKALELSQIIATQTWRPKNTLFETKKALLAIHENNTQELSDSLSALTELPQGKASIDYINGIRVINTGQLQEGKALLERALDSGLEGRLKADAQKSLDQVIARQNADRSLLLIVVENG